MAKFQRAFAAAGCSIVCCSYVPWTIDDTTTLDLHDSWDSLKLWADRSVPCPDTACFRIIYLRRAVNIPGSANHPATGVSIRIKTDSIGVRAYSFVFVNVIDSLLSAKRLLHYKNIVYDYVALHEFGHSYADLDHCRNDCVMGVKEIRFLKNFQGRWQLQDVYWTTRFCSDCLKKIAARSRP